MTWKRALKIVVLMLAAATTVAQAGQTCEGVRMACAAGTCTVEAEFPKDGDCRVRIDDRFLREQKVSSRINEDTVVRVRLSNVNLFRYSIAINTKETEVETYMYLQRLWKQVLGLAALGRGRAETLTETAARAEEDRFVDAINAWRTKLAAENGALKSHIDGFTTLALSATDKVSIGQRRDGLQKLREDLDALRTAAQAAIWRSENLPIYDATAAAHQETLDRLDAYEAIATVALAGYQKRIAFGDAGRVVSVTITANNKTTGQEAPQAINLEFFVHSTMPITFHAGYALRAMEEIDYEAVASSLVAAGGAELFTKVRDSNANGTFTAFLSYRIGSAGSLRRLPLLTIGTDFKDVGERLYGGISLPIGRAFLTVGAVNGETEEATGKITETLGTLGDVVGARELFTTVASKRRWGAFVSLSFAPF